MLNYFKPHILKTALAGGIAVCETFGCHSREDSYGKVSVAVSGKRHQQYREKKVTAPKEHKLHFIYPVLSSVTQPHCETLNHRSCQKIIFCLIR